MGLDLLHLRIFFLGEKKNMQDAVTYGAHRLHFSRQVRTVEDGRRKMAGSTKDRQVWANGEYLSGPRTLATKQ